MCFREKFKMGYTKITCRIQVELMQRLGCLLLKIYYGIKGCRSLARRTAIANQKWLSKFHTKYSNRYQALSWEWKCSKYWTAPSLKKEKYCWNITCALHCHYVACSGNFLPMFRHDLLVPFNPLNAQLNPICHLPALLGAHHILPVSRIRVKRSS